MSSDASSPTDAVEDDRDAVADGDLEVMRLTCPTCGVRHDRSVRRVLYFPKDADGIVDLLAARLNVQPCEACGRILSAQPTLMVFNTLAGLAVLARAPAPLLRELQAAFADDPDVELRSVAGYVEIAAIVAGWADAYMRRANAPLFTDAEPEFDAAGIALAATPLALLVHHEQVEGLLEPRLITEPPMPVEEQRRILASLYVPHVLDALASLYGQALQGDGLSAFIALVEQSVPSRCLTETVLTKTQTLCKGWEATLPYNNEELSARLQAEYTNATAHAVAAKPNPRGLAWAHFARRLFELDRNPRFDLPAAARLSTDALHRTLTFPDAWDTAAEELFDASAADDAVAWFEHLGMGERLREQMAAMPLTVDLSDLVLVPDKDVADKLLANLDDDSDVRRIAATRLAIGAIRAGRSGVAKMMLEHELDRLAELLDWEGLARQTIRAIAAFRVVGAHEVATALLRRHLDALSVNESILSAAQRVGLWNEIGNAARHQRDFSKALRAYDIALAAIADEPSADQRNDTLIMRRNMAIVQRESGRYSEAVRILEELERETQGQSSGWRVSVLTSLAFAYIDTGLPRRALTYAQEALAIPLSPTETSLRTAALLAHAAARIPVKDDGVLDEYLEALDATASSHVLHAGVAGWILAAASTGRVPMRALHQAAAVLDAVAADQTGGLTDSRATAIAHLAEYQLEAGDRSAASRLLRPVEELGLNSAQLPWQLNVLTSRLLEDTDLHRAFGTARAALDELDESVPESSGLAFATPWIGSRAGAQAHIARVYHRSIARGVARKLDFLDLADFLYARDIPGTPEAGDETSEERLASLAAILPSGVELTLVTFLESGEDIIAIAVNPREPEPQLDGLSTARAEILAAAKRFARGVGPTCVLPAQKERAEAQIRGVLADLDALLRRVSLPGHHVCIVPSPALVGLPLHAATSGDSPLLVRNPITTAPSLRTLHRALTTAGKSQGPRSGTIVTVAKEGDSEQFRSRLYSAASALSELLAPVPTRRLSDRHATKNAVLAAFKSSEQVIFLGHGADGASMYGRGLCVSDGIDLPRGPLLVDLITQLRRYVIDAADLERTETSPEVLVSMACSSGRAIPGPGGTRIGLERSMFTAGTQTIVAPLWDVAQEPALEFILAMMTSWRDHPDEGLGTHHRSAALAVRDRHPLLFDWASFALNGSFI